MVPFFQIFTLKSRYLTTQTNVNQTLTLELHLCPVEQDSLLDSLEYNNSNDTSWKVKNKELNYEMS